MYNYRLGVPHVELDAIHHLPGWTPIGDEEFRAVVAERIAHETWVIDGNYRARYLAAQSDPAYRDITFIRLRTHRDIAAFLARLGGADGRGGRTGRRRTI